MKKYHVNPKTGNPGLCKADNDGCPFGSSENHFATKAEARNSYEQLHKLFELEQTSTFSHKIILDKPTIELLDKISSTGAQPFVVGGTVRDSLATGAIPKDVDIEVHNVASMNELLSVLKINEYKVDEVGKSFGVLKTVLSNGMDIDISLPRRDNLTGDGHRGFEVEVDSNLTLADAAARRDFTINALYYDYKNHSILDPHGGMSDWEAKKLRHVSEAFAEDPLRVLRAMQLSSRFGLTIAPETAQEGRRIKDQFRHISTERVQEEWKKLFTKAASVKKGLHVLKATGWDNHFGLENIDLASASIQTDATTKLAKRNKLSPEVYGPAAIAMNLPKEKRRDFLNQSIVGSRDMNKVLRLTEMKAPKNESCREIKRWARELGKNGSTVKEWSTLHSAFTPPAKMKTIVSTAKSEASYESPQPDLVTGQKILDLSGSSKGGKWVGLLMREAAQAQDDEVFKDDSSADLWLTNRLKTFNIA